MRLVPQPGPLLVAVDLHLLKEDLPRTAPERLFDNASLAVAENSDGAAVYATDFQPGPSGFVRILVADRTLSPERAGALVQRVLELETYRTLALLGLPEAQRLSPSIAASERRLVEVTEQMRRAGDLAANHRLLDELTALAAEVEAGAAASVFRFGASRAYEEIVEQRLETIGERKVGGLPTWSSFLARRMKPALRTCVTTEARQSSLSLKLARAANLLRTRVDVELEQQNQQLLKSMNARTRLQLRLQTTVEGLSVAAITYYVVSLFGYFAKAAHESGRLHVEPSIATAAFVPIAGLAIWWTVRKHPQETHRRRNRMKTPDRNCRNPGDPSRVFSASSRRRRSEHHGHHRRRNAGNDIQTAVRRARPDCRDRARLRRLTAIDAAVRNQRWRAMAISP